MIFKHKFYGIQIDTQGKKYKKAKKNLQNIYSNIPSSKCLYCPGKKEVEADCCKTFSPPMLLIEFIEILKQLNNMNKEQEKEFMFKCIDSFMNIEMKRPCVLLSGILCSAYNQRPLGCRLFAMYTDEEWIGRLNKVAKQLDTEKKNIPFYNQCKNIKVEGEKKEIPKEESDKYFLDIYELDVSLFSDEKVGRQIVYNLSATYMPFESHYLCYKLGANFIETLTAIKLDLGRSKRKKEKNSILSLEYAKKEKETKEFIEALKKTITVKYFEK